jgi:anthraniloyl-CoA monooxygenase
LSYLLARFISPLTNLRRDGFGGSLENRLRYPLEVFDAIRSAWPAGGPMTVRVSASDWLEGGLTADGSVEVARAFASHGVDAMDVSTGQTVAEEKLPLGEATRPLSPTGYGTKQASRQSQSVRSALRRREHDHPRRSGRPVRSRRAHLYDPAWTLHAAADQGHQVEWVVQFQRGSRKPPSGRADGPRPRLELIRAGSAQTRHQRWRSVAPEP